MSQPSRQPQVTLELPSPDGSGSFADQGEGGSPDVSGEPTQRGKAEAAGSPRGKKPSFSPLPNLLSDSESLSGEIQEVLRRRLRIVAILLFIGYVSFMLSVFVTGRLNTPGEPFLFLVHAVMTATTAFVAWRLCVRCRHFESHLRFIEFVLFGGSAVLFTTFTIVQILYAVSHRYPPVVAPPWMLLIFTYALLVPNTWRRALAVTSVFAVIPIAILTVSAWTVPNFEDVARLSDSAAGIVLRHALMLSLSTATGVFGVASTRHLRAQAYEARRLGQYRLKEPLGEGGMGAVYVAEHVMLKRPCAIKLIQPGKAADTRALARFEREVRSTAHLSHWNIVEIYDYGETEEGTFYYVMEYLPGLNLSEIVDQFGPMSSARTLDFMEQTASALSEAHAAGMIHRDIKPANIYAAQRGSRFDVAKLLDFGLVSSTEKAVEDFALTREGTITGSPSFLSPEQALGDRPDERSDIYSLGAVAYFLLTGRPPFERETMMKTIMAHVHDEPPPPSQHVEVDAELQAVVLRCLQKDPQARYQTADELLVDLQKCAIHGQWNREAARQWWERHRNYSKRQLDEKVMSAALVET